MKHRPEYDIKLIGRNLKRFRKAKNLSVDDVREYLRLGSVQAVYKYERGENYPPADAMFALMELYEISLGDLLRNHQSVREAAVSFQLPDRIAVDILEMRHHMRMKQYFRRYTEYVRAIAG